MKLLFDENLSPKLTQRLAGFSPGAAHVDRLGLGSESDDDVWECARKHAYTIVTKDSGFHEKRLLRGYPPKII